MLLYREKARYYVFCPLTFTPLCAKTNQTRIVWACQGRDRKGMVRLCLSLALEPMAHISAPKQPESNHQRKTKSQERGL